MRFTETINQKDLFNKVKDIYEYFQGWEEYDPSMCDPSDIEKAQESSKEVNKLLDKVIQELDELSRINVDSYGC